MTLLLITAYLLEIYIVVVLNLILKHERERQLNDSQIKYMLKLATKRQEKILDRTERIYKRVKKHLF